MSEEKEEKKKETREERERRLFDEQVARINEMRNMTELEGLDVEGYVYRKKLMGGQESLPHIFQILEEEQVGIVLGPGKYNIMYYTKDENNKSRFIGSCTHNIGREYLRSHQEYCRQEGIECLFDSEASGRNQRPERGFASEIINGIDAEKLKGIAAFVGTLKAIMSPPPPPPPPDSSSKILEFVLAKTLEQPRQTTSTTENLAMDVLRGIIQKSPASEIKSQIELFKEFNSLANPGPVDDRSSGEKMVDRAIEAGSKIVPPILEAINKQSQQRQTARPQPQAARPQPQTARPQPQPQQEDMFGMDKIIREGVANIPEFIKQYNGDIDIAAKALLDSNPFLAPVIKSSKSIQLKFYQAIKEAHGTEMANKWARAYGFENLIEQEKMPLAAAPSIMTF